jgi:hypothetical protein
LPVLVTIELLPGKLASNAFAGPFGLTSATSGALAACDVKASQCW